MALKRDEAYLKSILMGGSLEDKLATPTQFREVDAKLTLDDLITPAREGKLSLTQIRDAVAKGAKSKSQFPKVQELKNPSERGRLLHYFANHELLAIETMAFVLLKFPDADEKFRQGVLRTLQDEQRHLGLYLKRMHDFGVEMGDFSLNLYFWNTLREMKSPLDFVTQMSLTFEQANLDFAYFYANLFQTEIDDVETGSLLKTVHDDEISHVAHGMKWFQVWRDPNETEYESYRKSLPYPMTPRRARGGAMFAAESREKTQMSKDFIESIRIAGGSRGKVPNYLIFNPQAELETSMPQLPKHLQQRADEMAPLILWLASEEDVVQLPKTPGLAYLSQVFDFKKALPEIVIEIPKAGQYAAFEEFKPWAWSKGAWKQFDALNSPVRKAPPFDRSLHVDQLFSKKFWREALKDFHEACERDSNTQEVLFKVDRSTSGRGHMRVPREQLGSLELKKKLQKLEARGESYVVEPFYRKLFDFSIQYELTLDGKVIEQEPRFFKVDSQFQYCGAAMGNGFSHPEFLEAAKFLQQNRDEIRKVHELVFKVLKEKRYTGPFGIDSLIHEVKGSQVEEGQSGSNLKFWRIAPLIEVNSRYTMGRVAHEIERAASGRKQKSGVFRFVNSRDLVANGVSNFVQLFEKLKLYYGENLVAVTEPSAQETWVFAVFTENSVQKFLMNENQSFFSNAD